MKNLVGWTALVIFGSASAGLATERIVYPETKKGDVVETLHGTQVADPYRWLEDLDGAETKAWIVAQNKVTFGYLEQIPSRERLKERVTKLWDYERFGTPFKESGRYFYSRNDGLQNQSVLYTVDALDGSPRELLNPNKLSADGTVALSGTAVSDDGKLLAYGLANAGSDWNEWRVRNVETGEDIADSIQWVKFSGASWTPDDQGFFYSRYDEPTGDKLEAVNRFQKVFYHKIGTPQSQDLLVYERPDQPEWGFGAGVTEDGRYLLLSVWQGTERKNRVYFRDLQSTPIDYKPTETDAALREWEKTQGAAVMAQLGDPNATPAQQLAARKAAAESVAKRAELDAVKKGNPHGFVELLNDFDAEYDFVGNDGPVFWFKTDLDAPRGRLIAIDTRSPQRTNWKEVIPQTAETLQGVSLVGNHLIAVYLKDAQTVVRVHDLAGKFVRNVDLPGIGSAGGFGGKRRDNETFYTFTSFTTPPQIYRYDVASGKSTLWKSPKVEFNPGDYEVKQVFYPSKDGTKVPMFLVHRKGIALDGNNPTYLYGYGGFNIPLTPSFSVANLAWLELGGVFAVANLRGGGEYGKEWHDAGRLKNKQNVFDDFIAAAEWLISNKYTQPSKLAIGGGSNGGLLVGAAMTQRPDLFGAAIPQVGVLDMLRFHKFTIGWAWQSDYGSPDDPEMFKILMGYSPLHNLKPGVSYPATMITTGDHDDRVVPSHSFKFAAALQAAHAGDAPVLIRVETRAGHGAGKPTTKIIEEVADRWAFLTRVLKMGDAATPQ